MLISVVFALLLSANITEAQNWPQIDLGRSEHSIIPQISPIKPRKPVRLKTIKEIESETKKGYLLPIPQDVSGIKIDARLDHRRRFCLPGSIAFIELIGLIAEDKFKKEIIVSSCIRDVKTQKRIKKETGRGAPVNKTAHLTGSAVDISRRNLSRKEEKFFEAWFTACVRQGSLKQFIKEGKNKSPGAHYHLDISPQFSYCGNSLFYRPDVRVALERYH